MKNESFERSLSVAAAVSLALWSAQVSAQQRSAESLEEVVVTGSLIEGTPEDTALPVEVITEAELENLGRPSNMDLVKTMSEMGSVVGETNRFNAYPVGSATVNLRNLGARFTTVVFNGRRFPEQYSAATGRFNNVSWIPNSAVGRVEVLKEGGAATYGADAVGGVVNYITRRNLDGLEVSADYRYIEDSDGDYNADVLWGTQLTNGNFMMVAGYQHRSTLRATDRDWSQTDFLENKTLFNWSASGSPGSYIFQRPVAGVQTSYTPASVPTSDRQMSATGAVRDPNCTALGGFSGWSATPTPVCYLQTAAFENLVEESDSYQLYSELNLNLSDNTELHLEGMYYQLDSPNIANYPGDALTAGGVPMTATGGPQTLNGLNTYYVSGQNPAVAQFLNNFRDSDGSLAFPQADIDAIVNGGRVALSSGLWRAFGAGGNPLVGEQDEQHNNTKLYRLTTELSGDLPEFWGTALNWNVAVTYSRVDYKIEANDMLVDRLQLALNGFGGPNCSGTVAGANGCQWFNPFSSAIERNVYTGQANPGYVPSLANSAELIRWMRVPIWLERSYNYYWLDAVVNGKTSLELPGGPVAMALGMQYRYSDEEFVLDDLSDRNITPCSNLQATTCTSRTGPLVFGRNIGVLGISTVPSKRHYPVAAVFAEAQLPLLDTLNLQIAGRYERFFSDVTDQDNDVFVPAVALKWQALDWLALRTSGGKTFSQVNPPEDDGPTLTGAAPPNNAFGGISGYTTANYDNVGVKPEKGTYFSTGFLIQAGNFSATADYFDVRVDDYARTMTANNVIRALLMPLPAGTAPTALSLINCASPLFAGQSGFGGRPFVELPSGQACVQGTTTLGEAIRAGSNINFYGATSETNSGELKTSGIDLTSSYRFENVFGGTFTPSVDVTYNLVWELGDFKVGGVTVAQGYDGLGYKNSSTGRTNAAVPEWRGSLGLLYNHGKHTFNLLVNYVPSIINENPDDFDATNDQNANIGNASGVVTTGTGAAAACTVPASGLTSDLDNSPPGAGSGEFGSGSIGATGARGFCGGQNTRILSGKKIESSTNLDLTYRVELPAEMSMSFTIYNLLNDEPSFDRATVAYNSGFGSPLERNYKMNFKKRF